MNPENIGDINYGEGREEREIELKNGHIYNVKLRREGSVLRRMMYFDIAGSDNYFLLDQGEDIILDMQLTPDIEEIQEINQMISAEETELCKKCYRYSYFYYINPYGMIDENGHEIPYQDIRNYYNSIIETLQPYILHSEEYLREDLNFIQGNFYDITLRAINPESKQWRDLSHDRCILIGIFNTTESVLNDKTVCILDLKDGQIVFFQMSELYDVEYYEGDYELDYKNKVEFEGKEYIRSFYDLHLGFFKNYEKVMTYINNILNPKILLKKSERDNHEVRNLLFEEFSISRKFTFEVLKVFFKYVMNFENCQIYKLFLKENDEIYEYKCLHLGFSDRDNIILTINLSSQETRIDTIDINKVFLQEHISEISQEEINRLHSYNQDDIENIEDIEDRYKACINKFLLMTAQGNENEQATD